METTVTPLSAPPLAGLSRIHLTSAYVSLDGALRQVETAEAALRNANTCQPLPAGAGDVALDLTGIRFTLARLRGELAAWLGLQEPPLEPPRELFHLPRPNPQEHRVLPHA